MATSCMASTASERKPPMTKSAFSRVMARSIALVASGTDWISLLSMRTNSIFSFLPPTLMPPSLLISSRAISAPAQAFSPWANAIGPTTAILMLSCARAAGAVASKPAAAMMNRRSIGPPRVGTDAARGHLDSGPALSRAPRRARSARRNPRGPAQAGWSSRAARTTVPRHERDGASGRRGGLERAPRRLVQRDGAHLRAGKFHGGDRGVDDRAATSTELRHRARRRALRRGGDAGLGRRGAPWARARASRRRSREPHLVHPRRSRGRAAPRAGHASDPRPFDAGLGGEHHDRGRKAGRERQRAAPVPRSGPRDRRQVAGGGDEMIGS